VAAGRCLASLTVVCCSLGACTAVPDLPESPAEDVAQIDAQPSAPADVQPCVPSCPLSRCGALDLDCGQPCAPCPSDISCADCVLRLEAGDVDPETSRVRLTLRFAPEEATPLPHLADIRVQFEGEVRILDIEVGQPLIDADKTIDTTLPIEDGVVRVPILSTQHLTPIQAGVWLTFDVRLGAPFQPWTQPVVFRLAREATDPILAPAAAEVAVADPRTLDPVSLWPKTIQ
jgi:hypothetical protein